MLLIKYLFFLGVLFVDSEAGGHDESHDHVKLHVPEFIHHDHHTKVVTIHHHHHKPKNEHHHHHHHHHPKPQIPHGPPPYHHTHHHKKSSTRTVSKGHTHLGQKTVHGQAGHRGHGHHTGSKHHSLHGHGHKHYESPASYDSSSINYESPSVNYVPPTVTYIHTPSYGNDYGSNSPSVPNIISSPHVHGVVHTVKQIKVFDSLPGALPLGNNGATGYEVTEQNDEGDEDIFTSVSSLPQSYPGTYGFVRSAAAEPGSDPFSDISQSNIIQSNNDPFGNVQPQPSYANLEDFAIQNHLSPVPTLPSAPSFEAADTVELDNPASAEDNDVITDLLSFAEEIQDDTPVAFSREAGIQHAIKTGGVETVSY